MGKFKLERGEHLKGGRGQSYRKLGFSPDDALSKTVEAVLLNFLLGGTIFIPDPEIDKVSEEFWKHAKEFLYFFQRN